MIPHEFVVFDVDDVVIDMDGLAAAGIEACRAPLVEALGETTAAAVHADFARGYADLRRQLRAKPGHEHPSYAPLRAAIERWQSAVLDDGHELKLWSRQTLLAVALERHGVPVTGDLVHRVTDDFYWATIRERSRVTDDARQVITERLQRGLPVHLATNSDGFLIFDEARRAFVYDPAHAVREKIRRLACVLELGLTPADITVGDPIGKPDARFFDAVLDAYERKLGRAVDLSRTLAVGDSLTNDVEPLMIRGARHGVWLLREAGGHGPEWLAGPPAHLDRIVKLRRLTQLADVTWP